MSEMENVPMISVNRIGMKIKVHINNAWSQALVTVTPPNELNVKRLEMSFGAL
jgi:hypothetical protein